MDPVLNEFCCDKCDGFVSTKKYIYTFMKRMLEVFVSFFRFHYNLLVAKHLSDLSEIDCISHVKCLLKLELVNDSKIMNNALV